MAILILLADTSIQLVPDGSILFHIALILIMFAVLNSNLFKQMNNILSEMEKKGSGAVAEAEELEAQARAGNKQYSDALRTARASGYKLMEERRGEELRHREELLGSLKTNIQSRLMRERAAIESESTEARNQFDSLPLGTQIRDQVLKPLENLGRVE